MAGLIRSSVILLGLAATLLPSLPAAADPGAACRKARGERIKSCTDSCISRAKAAVDPDVAARFKGYGCARNCARQEVFELHGCPGD